MAASITPTNSITSNVPASVVRELLTKYEFIPTTHDLAQNNAQFFDWQQSDAHFREFAVRCRGFTTNDRTVYVNRDILSLISIDLKEKIDRNESIIFDCSSASFSAVMTFLHAINSGRPTADFLLKLLPMLHECKLSFLSDLCAQNIFYAPVTCADLLTVAFRAENEYLLEFMLSQFRFRSQLFRLLEECNGLQELRQTDFGAKAKGRILEVMLSLPEHTAPPPPAGAPSPECPQLAAAETRFSTQFRQHYPFVDTRSQYLDFEIKLGQTSVFTSRAILAQSSRFFQQLFNGDLPQKDSESYSIDNATRGEVCALMDLVLPTPYGMVWRLTPAAGTANSAQEPTRVKLLKSAYKSQRIFNGDPVRFVNVFKLAQRFQMTGLVAYLTDVAVNCLPWRQRLQLADLFKSREIMASLLTDESLKEMKRELASSAKALDEFSVPTKTLLFEFLLRATNF